MLVRNDHREASPPGDRLEGFGQRLSQILRDRHDVDAKIESFSWCGADTGPKRRRAAGKLRRRLEQGGDDDRALFLLAPGLSGPVVRHALAHPAAPLASAPAGVFAFGAAFPRLRPRAIASLATAAIWILRLLVLALLALAVEAVLFGRAAVAFGADPTRTAAVIALSAVAALLLGVKLDGALRRARERLVGAQAKMLERCEPAERRPTRFICFHSVISSDGVRCIAANLVASLFQTILAALTASIIALLGSALVAALLYVLAGAAPELAQRLEAAALRPVAEAIYALIGGAPETSPTLRRPDRLLESVALTSALATLALLFFAVLTAPFVARARPAGLSDGPLYWALTRDALPDLAPNAVSEVLATASSQDDLLEDKAILSEVAERIASWSERRPSPRFSALAVRTERLGGCIARLLTFACAAAAILIVAVLAIDGDWFGFYG